MSVTLSYLPKRKQTVQYPEEPVTVQPRYRGQHLLHVDELGREKCVACFLCAAACPSECIYIEAADDPRPAEERIGVDEVTLLRGGPGTFAVLRSLIDTAQRSVEVEVYELGNPDLVAALVAAHEHGVVVTVIDDPSEQHSAVTALRLRGAGIDVVDYPVRRLMIDHVKLLVVDATAAVVGGINWGVTSPRNHDYDALIRGFS